MKINPNIAISDTGILFDPTTGHSFTVNEIGLRILNLIRQGVNNEEEIIDKLLEEYKFDPSLAATDITDFILLLKSHGLMED